MKVTKLNLNKLNLEKKFTKKLITFNDPNPDRPPIDAETGLPVAALTALKKPELEEFFDNNPGALAIRG